MSFAARCPCLVASVVLKSNYKAWLSCFPGAAATSRGFESFARRAGKMSASSTTGQQLNVIIDTDCGVDDAEALLLALAAAPRCNVIGVTTVEGNTLLTNVIGNVSRILDVAGKPLIPVFKGADKTVLGGQMRRAANVHGDDGFGGIAATIPVDEDRLNAVQDGAGQWIVDTVNAKPGQITLITLGPLTNLAQAIRLDSNLLENLAALYIMGGNHQGVGNVTVSAEFNFGCDPEAAHAVLEAASCCTDGAVVKTHIVTWETCNQHLFETEWLNSLLASKENRRRLFLRRLLAKYIEHRRQAKGAYFSCDILPVLAAVWPESVIGSERIYMTVELTGKHTRGQCVIDWTGTHLHRSPNVRLISEFDIDKLKEAYKLISEDPK